jgi:hypothetical protein
LQAELQYVVGEDQPLGEIAGERFTRVSYRVRHVIAVCLGNGIHHRMIEALVALKY